MKINNDLALCHDKKMGDKKMKNRNPFFCLPFFCLFVTALHAAEPVDPTRYEKEILVPTARDAVGVPMVEARAPYVVTVPAGISSSARQTLSWKFVPFTCSASAGTLALPGGGKAAAAEARVAD